jgi:predicted permease
MRTLFEDVRYGFRILIKNPAFATIALITMALGIGANTAVFSVVNAILLRALPGIEDPGKLVSMYRIQNGQTMDNLGYPDYRDYRDRNRSLTGLAAHVPAALAFNYMAPERVTGDLVTGNYFDVLGARPAAGRLLTADDDAADRDVAVISYGLWEREFDRASNAIGAKIQLNGYPFTVVGVAEREFRGTAMSSHFDVWVPLHTQPRTLSRMSRTIFENRSAGWLQLFGRLKPGVDVRHADVEMKTIAAQLAQSYSLTNDKRAVAVAPGVGIYPDDRAEVSGLLTLLAGAVGVLLLIACSNVAGLLMVRAAGRTREFALRVAIGAGSFRIVRQLLTEGLVLALIAGAFGVLVAGWATQVIIASSQNAATSLVRHSGAAIDGTVLGFTLLASIVTGLLFALVPATQSLKVDLITSLKSGLPGSGSQRGRLRSALVIAQVALCFVLLSAGGLLLNGLYRIVTANPGFDATHSAMAAVDVSLNRYSEERGIAFYRDVLDRLSGTPGVVSASLAGSIPPTEYPGTVPIFHPGEEPPPDVLQARSFELGLRVNIDHVSPNYFRTLSIPVLQGRDFNDRDRAGSSGVVIVSHKLAETMWPGENAIGKRIAYPLWDGPRRPTFEVVGVAADVKHRALTSDAPMLMYVPVAQEYSGRTIIVLRMAGDPASGIAAIQRAVTASDKEIAVFAPETGVEHSADSLWQQRMAAGWIGAFSIMALLLAAVGLYGVVAQSVAQRTREVGIRIALGADPHSVSALVIRQGMLLAFIGIAFGIPGAIVLGRVVPHYLAGIGGGLMTSLVAIAIVLTLVMLLACWIPARRASRVDPIEALRCE